MPLTDVQYVLGHAQLTTTQIYLTPRKEDVIARVLAHMSSRPARPASSAHRRGRPAIAPRRWRCCPIRPFERRAGSAGPCGRPEREVTARLEQAGIEREQ